MDNVKTLLAVNVRALREHSGWSRDQFSEKIGISVNYLSEIEAGKSFPRHQVIDTICQETGVQPSDLFKSREGFEATLTVETFALKVKERFPAFLDELLRQNRDGYHD